MEERQRAMEESAGHLDDALNKWSRLERPDLARKYHGRALEMTQLRLSGARLSQEVVTVSLTLARWIWTLCSRQLIYLINQMRFILMFSPRSKGRGCFAPTGSARKRRTGHGALTRWRRCGGKHGRCT